ncbi:hypothetical protein [Scytonema sp. PRP1]|uniref:hypothetical protein n=1 Tax=Scytonema sp. PRP1 TaxID=3120513 RepID=UPI00300CCC43
MTYDIDKLYSLLPAIHRIRDDEQGKPLKALLSVIAEQIAVLEEDLEQLYDDQFIETCAEWVIPYIGDLVGDRTLHNVSAKTYSTRAVVANTIRYRRRKGTATMLEQLARDVTGWNARVVEFFQLLATTQYMNHLRPENRSWVDLRRWQPLENLNTAFDSLAHTVDVRRIASGRGRYNIPNIGIFLWRLQAYPITKGTARKVSDGCYTFHPLGMDAILFNQPQTEDEITHLAEPINVPQPLGRRPVYEDLEALRQALADGKAENEVNRQSVYFGTQPVLQVFQNGSQTPIPSQQILVCNLSTWRRPSATKSYKPKPTPTVPNPPEQTFSIQVAVDPVLGRLAFANGVTPEKVEVSYVYGFSTNMGGGPYERQRQNANYTVSQGGMSLATALSSLGTNNGVIEIADSTTIEENFTITLASRQRVTIQAKNGTRPVIYGGITINSATDAAVNLDGLLIAKGIQVNGTANITLTVQHCTLAPWLQLDDKGVPKLPDTPSMSWVAPTSIGKLVLDHSISGRLIVSPGVRIEVNDSIIDALGDDKVALAASSDGKTTAGIAKIVRTTILGLISVQEIELAENSIFTGYVTSDRKQQGCVRFCYLPLESHVPRRYYCQPNLALEQRAKELNLESISDLSVLENMRIQAQMTPLFTSRRYSHPGYCQLSQRTRVEIRQGADDEAEMGAFHDLYQPQRETNLRVRLDEYLRFGLEAGIIYVT